MKIRNKKKISLILVLIMLVTAIIPLMSLAEGGTATPSAPTVQHNVTVDPTPVTLYIGNVSHDGTSQLKYLYSDENMTAHELDTIRNSGLLDSDYTSILPTEAGQVAVSNDNSVTVQDFYKDAGIVAANMFPKGTTNNTSSTKLYNETKYNELVSSAQTLVSAESTAIAEYSSNYNARKTAFEADPGNAGLDYSDEEEYCPPVNYTAEPTYPTDDYLLVDNVGDTGNKYVMFDGHLVNVSTVEVNRTIVKIVSTSADVISNVVSNLEELQTALNNDSFTEVIVTNEINLPNGTTLDGKGKIVRVEKPYVKENGQLEESPSTSKVFTIGSGSNVTIKNMTVMGGQVSGSAISTTGNLTMENVNVVRSNRGLDNDGGIVILKNCNFSLNVCRSAGAIWCGNDAKLILDGCSFTQNRSNGGSSYGGGAIGISSNSWLYANNTIIANNATQEIGGAINIYNGNVYLMNCIVSGNCTSGSASFGGGIGKNGGTFHAVNSIFVDNYANIGSDKVRSDIGIYSNSTGSLNNCVYSKIQGSLSSINNCKVDESNTTASTYTDSGIILSNGTTSASFSHPTLNAGTNPYAKHVVVKASGPAATGGIDTYFDYLDTSNIKMGYGDSSSITGLGGLSAPTSDKKVTTYYEGGTRASGVIGASGVDGEIAPTTTGIAVGTTAGGKWSCSELFASNETGAANMTANIGTTVTLTATPDDNYRFVGWYEGVIGSSYFVEDNTDTLISSEASYTVTLTGPLTIRAVFEPVSNHTVSFMDGTTELSTQSVADGGHATRPTTNPVKDTYRFVDWYLDDTLTTKFNFATTAITHDTLIYAKFVPTPVYPQYTGTDINSYDVTSDVITLYVGDVTERGTSQVKYLYTDKEVDSATLTEIGKMLPADYTAILPTEAGQVKASNNSNYAVDSTYTSASAVATANWAGTVTDTSSTILYNETAFNNMVTAAQREVLAEKLAEEDNLDGWTQRKNEWDAWEQEKVDSDPAYTPVAFPEDYKNTFNDSTTYPTDAYFIADNKGTASTDYIIRNGTVARVCTYPIGRTIVKVVNTSADVIPLPKLVGNSVLRTNASSATIKFNTDVVGTYYYVVTDSSTAPTAESIKAATTGVHNSGTTTVGTNTVNLSGLTTGAQYAYIVVEQDERCSNVLKIEMPYDVYYFEDFEAYQENAYISSGALSPISQVNVGTGSAFQKVTSSITGGKMLSLSSTSGNAADQIIKWDNMIPTAGKYIFEGDVCTQYSSSETDRWLLRFTLTNGSYGSPNKEAGIHFEKRKVYEATSETTPVKDSFEKDTWYHIKLEFYPEERLYDIYIDGEKVAEGLTMPSGLNRLAITSGHGYTAYYDNLKYYVDPSYIPTPEVWGNYAYRTNASSAKVKFYSKCSGTYYYQVTNSSTAPSADSIKSASTGVFGHDSASWGTNTINLSGLASGEQYVHILVTNHDNTSNIITIDMPYDVYYFDDFETYQENAYISSGALSPISQVNGGTGSANQKVTNSITEGKMLSLSSTGGTASDQIIKWDNMIPTAGKYIFEGDVCTQYSSSETDRWLLRFTLTNGSYGSPNKEAGIHFEKRKVYEATSETTPVKDSFEKDTWYHIKLEFYPEERLYDIYIDGEKVAEGLTMPSGLNRLAITSGHGYTAYYDNLKYYVDPSYIPTPEVLGSYVYRTNASSAKVKFRSKCSGTYYYQVTNSSTAPSADSIKSASTGVFGHDSASYGTNTINLDGLTSGEQYVHILVTNNDNTSNIITIDMPYDVYFADNFDSYDNDKRISGTDGIPEYTLQYNGTGDANQKVITAEQVNSSTGKVLQLQGSGGWASDVRHNIAADDKQYVVFEANIKPVSGSSPGGVNFGSSSAGGYWTNAVCRASFDRDNKFNYGKNDSSSFVETDVTHTLGTWYNLKMILDNTNNVYYILINGNIIGEAYEADAATPEWFSLGGGNLGTNTMYYDDVKAYTTDTTTSVHTVTFKDGETELLTRPVADGGHVTRPTTDPTKEGYRFVNWYADSTFTTKFDFANAAITQDIPVYAKFSPTSKYPSNSGSIFNSYNVSSNVVTLYVGDVARDGTSQMKYLYTDEEVDTATLTEMAKILPSAYTAILPSTEGQIKVSNKSGVTVDETFKAAKDVVNNISIGASSYTISDTSSTNILYDETSFSSLVTATQTEITAERLAEEDNLEAWNERKAEWDAAEQVKADEDPSYTKKDFPEIYVNAFNDSTTYPTDSYFIADNKGTSTTSYVFKEGVATQVETYPLGRTIIKVVNTSANVETSSLSAIAEKVDSLDKESTIYAGEIFVDGTSQMQYLYSSDVSNYRNVFESLQTSFNGTAFQGLVPTLTEDSETSGLACSSAHQDEMNSNWTNSSYVASQYFEGTVGTETNGNLYDNNSTFKSNIDTAEASHQAEMTTPIAANKRVFSTRGTSSNYEYRLIDEVYRRVITITFKIEATTVIYTKVDVTSPTYYDLWVGDTRVSSANASNVLKNTGDATVVYDVTTNTLTLNGATITGSGDEVAGYGIRYTGSNTLNIVANGTNVVSDTGTRSLGSAGLLIGGPVGDWTATSVDSNVNITVNEGAKLTINGGTALGGSYPGSYGICSWNGRGNITVSGSGDLNVNAGTSTYTYGITTYGDFIVNSTGKVNISTPNNVHYGVGANVTDVIINSGTVNVVSGKAERVSQAISTRDMSYVDPTGGNITINGGMVTATSGTVSLSGGTGTYDKSYSNAIYAEKDVIINGGTVEAKTMATSGDEIYAINKAPTFASGIDALASTNSNGTNPVAYNSDDNATYKYFRTPATVWTVSFETFGGSTIASQRIVDGKKATRPSTNPSREDGYEFFGWCSNENMSTAFDFNQAITGNTTVYVGYYKDVWVDNTVDKSVATVISEVQVKETITGEEATYEAFNENVNTTYGSNAASEEVAAKINSARSATETFMTNNGYTNKSVTNTTSVTADYDHRVYPSAVYEYDSTLKCIKRTHIANGDYAKNTTYKMIYSAEYTKPSYDVSFMDGTTILFTQSVVEGGRASVPTTNPTKEDWEFDAWCADTTLTTLFNFGSTITGPTSVYVRWKPIYKDVTLLLTDGMTWDESSLTEEQLLEINLLVYRGVLVVEQDENDPTIEHYKNRDGKVLFMTAPNGSTKILTFGEGVTYQDNITYELTEEDKGLISDSIADLYINKLTLSFGNPPFVYMVTNGANQTHTKQSGLDMTVTANGDVAKFKELRTDGTAIGENDRTIVSGSTIATLKSAYLDSLAEGTHTLTFIYVDGECSTNFTIAKAETKPEKTEKPVEATLTQTGGSSAAPAQVQSKGPRTGDNVYLWCVLLIISTGVFIGTGISLKKNNK